MEFFVCANCKLSLPRNKAVPMLATIKGRKQKVLICEYCREKLINKMQGKNEKEQI